VVFCAKDRRKVLVPPLDSRLQGLTLEKQEQYGYAVIELEGVKQDIEEQKGK
jgi:REP element-mobilizing transposase RayT